MQKESKNRQYYINCQLCPRNCGVNRLSGMKGVCQMTADLMVARAALHFWEEPCISGTKGSGAVFFSGCNMHCCFCQNEEISWGKSGKIITTDRLTEIFWEQKSQGANNINLVTATHYVPTIVEAIEKAKSEGFDLPFIYNCSGYEEVDTLKMLEGLVDVYLPDFKYMSPELSLKYSHASDYAEKTKLALAEMVRQQPQAVFYQEDKKSKRLSLEAKEGYLIKKGVIVRQLLLPEALEDAKEIVSYLHGTYGDQIFISMMSQYTPMQQVMDHPVLGKKVTEKEYEDYLNFALELGVTQGFFQDGQVAKESFIPHFDNTGV